jgi:RND family efflux transporter MFP subunit
MRMFPFALAIALAPLASLAASFEATMQRSQRAALGVPVSGVVAKVEARGGQVVQRGAVLIALDATPFEAAVEAAQAEVTRQGTRRAEAQRDYKQAKELYERTVLSTVDLENARNQATRGEADYRHAQAQLKKAKYDLAQSRITAPYDAVVLSVHAHEGETILSQLEARPLVTIAAHGGYLAVARVAPDRAAGLQVDRPATVAVSGKDYAGKLTSVSLEQGREARGEAMYRVEVTFSAPEGAVAVGQSGRIEVP